MVPVLAVLGFAVLAVFLWMRFGSSEGIVVGGQRLTGDEVRGVQDDLCRTRQLAPANPAGAGDLFFGRVHSPLHVIARAVEEADRPAAARLLEAKNDVERAFNAGAGGAQAAAALDRLLPSLAEALRSVGVTPSTCDTRRP